MVLRFLKQCVAFVSPQKKIIRLMVVLTLVVECMKIVPTVLFKEIIDLVGAGGDGLFRGVLILAASMFLAQMLFALVDVILDRKISAFVYWIEVNMPRLVQQKLLELSLGYHEHENTGEKITRLDRGTWKLIDFACNFFWMVQPLVFQTVLTIGVLFFLDWQIGLLFTFAIPVFVIMSITMHKKVYPWRCRQEDLYEDSSSHLAESIVSIKTVQAFAQEEREHSRYVKFRHEIEKLGTMRTIFHTRMNFWRFLVINTARFAIVMVAAYKAMTGNLSVGSVVLVLTLSEKVYISLFSLNQVMDRMVEATEPMQRLFDLLETKSELSVDAAGIKPDDVEGEIAFRGVGFKYLEGKHALRSLNFTAPAGKTVALVGPSGSGKSTIVKLLLRYYDPQRGSVLFDGVDLRDLDLQAFRQQIGYVPQEVEIMSGTIRENIAYGNPDATDEEIQRAAKLARVDEFVQQFEYGYETKVGERGMRLSGGQRQRVGIARALLTDPAVLVFDEATSSLDTLSERAIQEAVDQIAGSKTIIIIAHRLSTVRNADKIVVVKDGECVEEGTHAELLLQNGVYKELIAHQSAA